MNAESINIVYDPEVNAQTLASHGKTFYWASFFLGKQTARHAASLYALCRHLDDAADDKNTAVEHKRYQLEQKKQSLSNGCEGWPLAQTLIDDTHVPASALDELLNGLIHDTHPVQILSQKALLHYCYRVAGTVGLMMCPILGVHHHQAYKHAIDLGIAMQLTNICRDVLEDAHMGRRYIPLDLSPAHIIDANDDVKTSVQREINRLLSLADQYYQSGLDGLAYLPKTNRSAIFFAAHLYRAIGKKLTRQGTCWWQGRVFLSKREKAWITLRLLPRSLALIARSSAAITHPSKLHDELRGLPYVD
jgi:15-cis-phytoene synthase